MNIRMGLLKTLFRRNREVFIVSRPQHSSSTPISSVRRKYLLLGREYAVRIGQGERNSLEIEGDVLNVTLKEMSRENFETFIEGWYRRTARRIIQQSIDQCPVQGSRPQIKLYKMRRAWGRCYYQKGVVTFNLYLVKAPQECVDYIVLHELCHFTHHNHGYEFKSMVAAADPDWKRKDQLLKDFCRSRATLLQRLHI